MGSTYLTLTNDLLKQFNENTLDSSTFATARGVQDVAKQAIRDAVKLVNTQNYIWPFNVAETTQLCTVGTNVYSFPSTFKIADMNSFYIEKDDDLSVTTRALKEITKEEWFRGNRLKDLDMSDVGVGTPVYVFFIDGKFGVTPNPDKDYTIHYRYYTLPDELADYDDTTTIPTAWNYVIYELAKPYMFRFRANEESAAATEKRAKDMLDQMRAILVNDEFHVYVGQKDRRGRYAGQYSSTTGYL